MLFTRKPDLIIGAAHDPQTLRWVLLNVGGFQVALHKWLRSDSDRALHDHKADNISIVLNSSFREWFSHEWEKPRFKTRYPWVPYFRRAETPHRIELHRPWAGPVWSIWIRFAPRRKWGFWCKNGWVDAEVFLSGGGNYYEDGVSETGRGCS